MLAKANMGSCVSASASAGSENNRGKAQRSPGLRPTAAPTGAEHERGEVLKSSFLTADLSAGRVRQYVASSGIVFKPVFPHRSEFPFGVRVAELARVRELLVRLVRDPVAATQQQRAWNSNQPHISLAEADRGSREEPFHLERVSRNLSSIWIRAFNAVKLLYGYTDNDAQNELLDEHEFRSALRFVYCFLEVQNILDVSGIATGAVSTTTRSPAATLSPVGSAREETASKRSGGAVGDDDIGGDAAAAVSRSFEMFSADVSQSTRDGQHHVSFALSVSPATPPLLHSPAHVPNLPPPNVFRVSLSYYRTHVTPAVGIAGRRLSLAAESRQSPIAEFTDAAPLPQTYEILRDPEALFERIQQLELEGSASGASGVGNASLTATAGAAATGEYAQHLSPLSLHGSSEPSCRHDELCDVICRALLEAHVFRQRA